MYSEQDLELDICVTPVGKLTFTYPEHNEGWNVELKGNKIRVDDKPYDYLFWEGERSLITIPDSGFVVSGDETVQFLEESLDKFGLNSKEANDFITYWGPELVRNDANHITFIYGETYDELIGEIECSIPVEFELRLFMLYTPCNAEKKVKKQTLPKVERSEEGLRLIEWGGGLAGLPNL